MNFNHLVKIVGLEKQTGELLLPKEPFKTIVIFSSRLRLPQCPCPSRFEQFFWLFSVSRGLGTNWTNVVADKELRQMDVPQIFGTSWMFRSKLPYSFDNIQSQSETCESLTISRCVWAARNDRTWKVGKRGKFANFKKPERWGCEGRGRSGIDGLVITFHRISINNRIDQGWFRKKANLSTLEELVLQENQLVGRHHLSIKVDC